MAVVVHVGDDGDDEDEDDDDADTSGQMSPGVSATMSAVDVVAIMSVDVVS